MSHELPPYAGMDWFVKALGELLTQPRKGRDWLPVILLHSPEDGGSDDARRVAPGLRAWLGGERTPRVRHAYLDPAAYTTAGVLAPIREIAAQLRRTTRRRGEGRLALPGVWLLSTVADAPPEARDGSRGARRLRDHCYARHREESWLARTLWAAGGQARDATANSGSVAGALWHGVSAWLFQWLPRWCFGRRMRRRLRWFTRWAESQAPVPDGQHGPLSQFSLFAAALCQVPGVGAAEVGREALEKLYRVLAQALLIDLDRAVRRNPLRPRQRRRTTRHVLLFQDVGDEHSREQLLVREIRAAARPRADGGHGCTSALVVAAGATSLAARLTDSRAEGFGAAADTLRGRPGHSGVVVNVPPGPANDAGARDHLTRSPLFVGRGPRIGPAAEIATVTGSLALAASLVAVWNPGLLSLWEDEPCDGSTFLSKDGVTCVGLKDSSVVRNEQVRAVLREIEAENERVDDETAHWPDAEEDRPLPRTVVYIGPLTGEGAEEPVLGGTLAELRGIALAQHTGNLLALNSRERVPLKVLVADAGDRFQDASAVVSDVVAYAEDDESIVGVVGMGQSRDTVYQALETLDEAGLPVVGTTGTSEDLLEHGRHFYQTVPTNGRAGAAMASFIEHHAMVARPDGGAATAERVLLVADPQDSYSNDLATDFRKAYGTGLTRTLLYSPPPEIPGDELTPVSGERQDTLLELASTVCEAVRDEPRAAVVWGARGDEFIGFLRELRPLSEDCPRLTVLGDDEITHGVIADGRPFGIFPGLTLYRVAHGGGPVLERSVEGQLFTAAYEEAYEATDSPRLRALRFDSQPALAWDAVRYLAAAVDGAWATTGGDNAALDRHLVQGILYQGLGDGGYEGATGRIDAPGVGDGRRLTEDKAVQIVEVAAAGPGEIRMICGAVTDEQIETTWGEDGRHPCPPGSP